MEYIRRAPNCEGTGSKGGGYIIKNLCPTCGGRGRVAKKAKVKVSMGSSKASLRIP